MLVEINYSAANTTTNCTQQDFDKLLQTLTYKNRYTVLLKEKAILNARFVQNISAGTRDIINQLYTASINISKKADCLVTGETGEPLKKEFSVEEAIIYFESPLEIILENCNNDSYFLSAIFKAYKPNFNFEKKLESRWITVCGNGGCKSVKDIVARELRSSNDKPKMLRLYVILDSDKHYKTEIVTKYSTEERLFTENNIPYHILEKRSAENYLPTPAFDQFYNSKTSKWIEAFKNLTEDQKDYIDISRGYHTDAGKDADIAAPDRILLESKNPNEADFLKSISDSNFTILWGGLNIGSFKTIFPTAFEHHTVYNTTLSERTKHQNNPSELQQIVEEIAKFL